MVSKPFASLLFRQPDVRSPSSLSSWPYSSPGLVTWFMPTGLRPQVPVSPGIKAYFPCCSVRSQGGVSFITSIVSILLVRALSANTAFADFPRLCRAIAQNNYLPHSFATRSRRLVYSYGIYLLAGLAGVLLILFRGVTDRLIPLFAVGAFLAFTLSQAAMVGH